MSGKGAHQLAPVELSRGEFDSNNVFIAYSRKIGREIMVIGPACYDVWLILEFDVNVLEFCERPPLGLSLLPLKDEKTRPFDFWIRYRNGRRRGIIVADPHHGSPDLDLMKRSIDTTKEPVDIWLTTDLSARLVFLRNLKQLAPFVGCDRFGDARLQTSILEQFGSMPLSWSQVRARCRAAAPSAVDAALAHLIHAGQLTAELNEHALDGDSQLARA